MEKIRLLIGIRIKDGLEERIIGLNKIVSKNFDTDYKITKRGPYAHVTLFFGEFEKTHQKRLYGIVESIAKNTKSFKIITSFIYEIEGYILLKIIKNKDISNLHNNILNQTDPFCIGDRPPFLRKHYNPHVTISKIEDLNKAKMAEQLLKKEFKKSRQDDLIKPVIVNEIVICEMLKHSQCGKVLKTFPLS